MHPGFMGWWKHRHAHACDMHAGAHGGRWGDRAGCSAHAGFHAGSYEPGDPGGGFGVRRPLRFLAHKLELNESQLEVFARALDALKTERAQASVDQRRRVSTLAEALEQSDFDEGKLREAGEQQEKSASQVRAAVETALRKMHAVLDADQRKRLAYLLRTGVLSI
ncbi:MAG TPA: periplasmic heavy metal sensor [Polyangiales bacterium]|nr:periplasmic heavy metal sensor [Polyangiales bacterium]